MRFYAELPWKSQYSWCHLEANREHQSKLEKGFTPLQAASFNGHVRFVHRLLKDNKGCANETTLSGISPLYMAADVGHYEVVRLLIESGIKDI